jgi:hypothetical protein
VCVCVCEICSCFECEKKYAGPACGREPWGYPSCVQPRRAMIRPVYAPDIVANDCMCVCVRPSVREGALGLPKLRAAAQGNDTAGLCQRCIRERLHVCVCVNCVLVPNATGSMPVQRAEQDMSHLFVCLCVDLTLCQLNCLSICLSLSLSVCPWVGVPICLSISQCVAFCAKVSPIRRNVRCQMPDVRCQMSDVRC